MSDVSSASLKLATERLRSAGTKGACLEMAWEILTTKYHGNRLKTLTRFWQFFPRQPEVLWKRKGFLHCTNFNALLRTLLLRSGHFISEDIRTRWTLIWHCSPHQYVQVRMDDKHWINVDLWGHAFGIRLGDYSHGFHRKS